MQQLLIIVLDMDGTIIGDISPQIVSYDIHNLLKKNGATLSYRNKDLASKLLGGIIRPFFPEFIHQLQSTFKHIEFFVYTASERKWAMYVIKHIEKACNIKFARPIFTRANCIQIDKEYRKSLKSITPAMYKSLKKKYQLQKVDDIEDCILAIDNMDVYNSSESKSLIHCKTYDYQYPENIPAIFDHDSYSRAWKSISGVITRYYGISVSQDFIDFQLQFYPIYVKTAEAMRNHNQKYINDALYNNLYKILVHVFGVKKYNKFTPSVVRYINKKLIKTGDVARCDIKKDCVKGSKE